jgi:hypothetical protein
MCDAITIYSLTSGMGSSFRHRDQSLILIMNHPRWTLCYAYRIWTPLFRSQCRFCVLFEILNASCCSRLSLQCDWDNRPAADTADGQLEERHKERTPCRKCTGEEMLGQVGGRCWILMRLEVGTATINKSVPRLINYNR